ncbi:PREDICTED: nuclease HARBI1 [Prunus dulcis]|uniref:PREDICTED: nuclease HARBI1 n=1 Tax=Prunus dulcis TaxID=3755 RepID=A0A5E4EQP2_PRUDU|nr:uncharacterized protein LOC117627517 [Prunus dulcis]VVA17179.1 PREDICTED: nuclease HARBI1 [Prunus dulcis]
MDSNLDSEWEERRRQMIEEGDARMSTNTQLAATVATLWTHEQIQQQAPWGGFVVGHSNKRRGRAFRHQKLMMDYFVQNHVYAPEDFRRRFQMRRHVFLGLVNGISNVNPYFRHTTDATGSLSFSPHQKLTSALQVLAYASSTNQIDESMRMSESTSIENLGEFCRTIVHTYRDEYLRQPPHEDLNMSFFFSHLSFFLNP